MPLLIIYNTLHMQPLQEKPCKRSRIFPFYPMMSKLSHDVEIIP